MSNIENLKFNRYNSNENESQVNVGDRINHYKNMVFNAFSNVFSSIKTFVEDINKKGEQIGVNPQTVSEENIQQDVPQQDPQQNSQQEVQQEIQRGGRRKSMMSVRSYTRRLKKNNKKQKNKTNKK